MNILDKLEYYLDNELIDLIILPLYNKYLKNIKIKIKKQIEQKKFDDSLRLLMSSRFSGVYK